MSVSSVDPPNTQKPPRLVEFQHLLELRCGTASEATQALLGIWQTQALCAATALNRMASPESSRLSAALGSPSTANTHEGEHLYKDALALQQTFERLAANYEPGLRELAAQSLQALKNAAHYSGREQQEELRDAFKLLKGILDNPLGNRNYAVWFEFGWAQWMLREPLETVAESFYHAARLSGNSGDLYHLHALRHLAYLQASVGKWSEAWETAQRALERTGEGSPSVWIEAARYALGVGALSQAQALLDRALDHSPESAFALFSDPDLTPLYGACSQTMERFARAAHEAAAHELERLHTARQTDQYLMDKLGLKIEMPPVLTLPESIQSSSLFEAHALAAAAHVEASQIFDTAIDLVEKEEAKAMENARRLKVQIDQSLSEKAYYEGSLRNIEEHARESGFSLHAYSFNNPFFRKRNGKAEDARFAYESFRQQLAQSETYLKDHLPAMEAAFDKHESRRQKVSEVLQWLIEKRAS